MTVERCTTARAAAARGAGRPSSSAASTWAHCRQNASRLQMVRVCGARRGKAVLQHGVQQQGAMVSTASQSRAMGQLQTRTGNVCSNMVPAKQRCAREPPTSTCRDGPRRFFRARQSNILNGAGVPAWTASGRRGACCSWRALRCALRVHTGVGVAGAARLASARADPVQLTRPRVRGS